MPDAPAHLRYALEKSTFLKLLELDAVEQNAELQRLQRDDPELADLMMRRLALSSKEPLQTLQACVPQLSRYRILKEIGRGGMGQVWLAERADNADGQKLAIKQIRDEFANSALQARFESERRFLAKLDHPGIVPLVDAGVDQNGRPFLVTPYVEGQNIDAFCSAKQVKLRERVRLLRDVVAALAHAHQQFIVHRDLKPANILVDAGGRVRLLDFGIAKALDDEGTATAEGASMMTLRYASPEQVSGGSASASSDLYAIGVLLFKLITERSPYGELHDPAALLHAILHVPAARLPERGITGERIPSDLAAITAVLLRKQANERYSSAEALLQELDRWLAGEAVQAMRGVRWYRSKAWLRKRWPWFLAAGVALGFVTWHNVRMQNQLERTEVALQQMREVSTYLINLFDSAKPSDTKQGEISALALLKSGAERLLTPDEIEMSDPARISMLLATARVLIAIDDFASAKRLIDEAERLNRGLSVLKPEALAETLHYSAMVSYSSNDIQTALAKISQALALIEGGEHTQLEIDMRISQCAYLSSGLQTAARECHQRLLALTDVALSNEELREQRVSSLINYAEYELTQGAGALAEQAARTAIANIPEQHFYTELRDYRSFAKAALARALLLQNKHEEALRISKESLLELQNAQGADAREMARYQHRTATILIKMQRYEEALPHALEASRVAAKYYPANAEIRLSIDLNLVNLHLGQGQFVAAQQSLSLIEAELAKAKPLNTRGALLLQLYRTYLRCQFEPTIAAASFQALMPQVQKALADNQPRLAEYATWSQSCQAKAAAVDAVKH